MTDVPVPPELRALHPLLARLVKMTGACVLTPETYDAWVSLPGPAMLLFGEDPERFQQSLDLAQIAAELHATGGSHFRVGLLPPAASRTIAPRYSLTHWPAFIMLRDGHYLGAVEAFTDMQVRSLDALLLSMGASPLPPAEPEQPASEPAARKRQR